MDLATLQAQLMQGEDDDHLWDYNESEETTGVQLIQASNNTDDNPASSNISYSFLQMTKSSIIPKRWILLDNQSIVDIFCNTQLFHNIHTMKTTLHIHCNVGVATMNQQGELHGYGPCGTIQAELQTYYPWPK